MDGNEKTSSQKLINESKLRPGGNPAAFDHVLILMPTLFRLNELSVKAVTMIEKQNPEHKEVFKKLGKP